MDGNGRWAQKRSLPRMVGHREGTESVRAILKACAELGVKYLTLYTFSTENWARPRKEVDFLMSLFAEKIVAEIEELMSNEVKLNFLGRIDEFSPKLQEMMNEAMARTKDNKKITLNLMVNYGGRAELVDAVNSILNSPHLNVGNKFQINEEAISQHLYTKGMPDPDLLIRTANEMRISNYLLWQIAYAEIYVTKVLWPDFRRDELIVAIEDYQQRTRKFGKTKEQVSAT